LLLAGAAQAVQRCGSDVVGRQEDHDLLGIGGGQFHHLAIEPELADRRQPPSDPGSGRQRVPVHSAAELGTRDRGELGLESARAFGRGTEPQVKRLLVGDLVPVRKDLTGRASRARSRRASRAGSRPAVYSRCSA
jgi:hypothetical protein